MFKKVIQKAVQIVAPPRDARFIRVSRLPRF